MTTYTPSGSNLDTAANPIPGTGDPCLGCGIVGSVAYTSCHLALAAKVGQVPPCAQAGISQNQGQIGAAAAGLLDPVAQGIQNAILGPLEQYIPGIAIRAGLFLGALLLVVVGFFMVAKGPDEET